MIAPDLRPLERRDEDRARRFLDAHPERDLYLRGLVVRLGTTLPPGCGVLFGAFRDGRLVGMFLHSATVLLASADHAAIESFADQVAQDYPMEPITEVLGPAAMVTAFYERFRVHRPLEPRLRLYRPDLPLMELRREHLVSGAFPGRDGSPIAKAPLRRALESDLPQLAEACRAMTLEELGVDPAIADPVAFRGNCERKVRAGREFVWTEDSRIVFRAAVSSATPEAALVEGVYVPPDRRGEGIATRGMLAMARRLLQVHAAVVLFVSCENLPALALYRRLGFRDIGTYQAVYFEG